MGTKDFGVEITLHADDGRKFSRSYSFNLKANTPPPKPGVILAQTTTSPAHYVLCLKIPDMDVSLSGGKLHKDIAKIKINDDEYPLTIKDTNDDFVKPSDTHFIEHSAVAQLSETGSAIPPSGVWILYYDTGVKTGDKHHAYKINLKDEMGLVSEMLEAGTSLCEPPVPSITITKGEKIPSTDPDIGTSDTKPVVIKGDTSTLGSEIQIQNIAGTIVHCTVTDTSSTAAPAQYDANPVTFELGLGGTNEKLYKVEYHTTGDGFKPSAVKTIYYRVLKQHTVTFNENGGAYTGGTTYTILVPHTMTATAPTTSANPTRTGYTFGNWYKEAACTTQWIFTTPITGDTALYAKWNPRNDTVYKVFHYQEKADTAGQYPASPHETDNLTGTTGHTFTTTEIDGMKKTTYQGFEFDKQEPASPSIAADGSTIIKLYYKRKTVQLTFNLDGGTIDSSTANVTLSGRFGAVLTPPSPVKTGYTLTCWNPALSASPTFPAVNTPYTAQWVANSNTPYKVKHLKQNINDDNYTEVTADTENLQGITGTNAAVTPKTTYTGFEAGTYTPATIAADGTTVIEVKYNRTQYTVTFNANGGSPAPSNQPVRYEGKVPAPSTLTKQGYDFDKWYKDPSFTNEWNFATDTVIGAATLYAKWNPRNDTPYTVKHLQQNVTGSGYTEVTADAQNNLQGTTGTNATVTPKTYTGFEAGTYTSATIAADGSTVVEVKYNRKVYTVTFNANGGTPAPFNKNVRYEGNVTAPPTMSKTGYTFSGWYKSSTYTGAAWNFASNTITANITLYAKWTANTYKVRFNGGTGSSGSMPDQTFTYDEAPKQLRQNTFTKTNHRFTGWATSSGSSTVVHTDKASVNNLTAAPNGTFDLYAVWVPLPKVTFKVEGGKGGKLKCTYDGTTKETSSSTGDFFIVEYGNISKNVAFTAEPDSGWALAEWRINPGPFSDGGPGKTWAKVTNIVSDVTVTVTFYTKNLTEENATWKDLLNAVKYAPSGSTLTIDGEIKATAATGNNGEIKINKNLTIKEIDSSTRYATIDADNRSRIFNIESGTLTMERLNLKNGKSSDNGAGIFVNSGASLELKNYCSIKDCVSSANGGGIYMAGTCSVLLEDSDINNCIAKKGGGVYVPNGNTFKMKGRTAIGIDCNDDSARDKNAVYLENTAKIDISAGINNYPVGGSMIVRIIPQSYSVRVVLTGTITAGNPKNYTRFMVKPNSQYWFVDNTGKLSNNTSSFFNDAYKDLIESHEPLMKPARIPGRTELLNKMLLYKTSEGNFGIMQITQANSATGAITFNYKTYNSNGIPVKSENGKIVQGTYNFDLDTGFGTGGVDFWLENETSTEVYLTPKNGAQFYLMP
ncbi:MAG: InlB B-repeat-containing protein [Treponema sp.]